MEEHTLERAARTLKEDVKGCASVATQELSVCWRRLLAGLTCGAVTGRSSSAMLRHSRLSRTFQSDLRTGTSSGEGRSEASGRHAMLQEGTATVGWEPEGLAALPKSTLAVRSCSQSVIASRAVPVSATKAISVTCHYNLHDVIIWFQREQWSSVLLQILGT
jgi:hypothetical protein